MTNIVTRYFASASQARAVAFELIERQRFSPRIVTFYDAADGLAERLTKRKVDNSAAQAYQAQMEKAGGAVLLIKAGSRPLAAAKKARTIMADMGAAEIPGITEEVQIDEGRAPRLSSFRDAPHILTRATGRPYETYHMANWPIGLISRRKPFNQMVIRPHGRMADLILPLTIRRKPYTGSIFPRHARMANFPIPLISRRKPADRFAFPRHARMANFPIPLISKRKPYTGTLIGKHTRIANWPFPHLINGERGTNALIPGGPRMANFPIPLTNRRKPFTGSIFPRHARMANFPIPLISRRTPIDAFAFPRHARMADMILPLVITADKSGEPERKGFSFSKMLGLPTLVRR